MRESRAYLELTGRDKKMDVKHSTRNKLRAGEEKVGLKGESTGRQVRHEPLHGELAKEGDPDQKRPEEGGESCEKKKRWEKVMISFWAPGSPGSRVITQGSEEDSTIIDSSRSNEAAADTASYCLQISQLSEKRKVLVLSVGRLLKHNLRPLFSQINCVSINIVENGSLTSAAHDEGKCCLYPRKVPNMLKAKDLSGSASVPRTLHSSTLQHFNSSTGLSRLEVCHHQYPCH